MMPSQERKARERCHLEALKSAEKLRLARAQATALKERLRLFEVVELRYPSRFRAGGCGLSGEEQPRNEPRAVRQEPVEKSRICVAGRASGVMFLMDIQGIPRNSKEYRGAEWGNGRSRCASLHFSAQSCVR